MPAYGRFLAIFLAAGGVGAPVAVRAEPADAASAPVKTTAPILAQVTYLLTVTTRGMTVESAPSVDDAIFGTVPLACLARGGAAIISRDVRHLIHFESVIRTPPSEDLALRPYSRVFSELRRIAWNVCTPAQKVAAGEERTVETGGTLAVGGVIFPSDLKIQDRLGSAGCEVAPSGKTNRALPCTSSTRPQPFVSTLTRHDES